MGEEGLSGKNLPQNKGQQSLETKRYAGKDSGIRTGLCHTAGMTLRDGQLLPEHQVPDPLNKEQFTPLRASNFWKKRGWGLLQLPISSLSKPSSFVIF